MYPVSVTVVVRSAAGAKSIAMALSVLLHIAVLASVALMMRMGPHVLPRIEYAIPMVVHTATLPELAQKDDGGSESGSNAAALSGESTDGYVASNAEDVAPSSREAVQPYPVYENNKRAGADQTESRDKAEHIKTPPHGETAQPVDVSEEVMPRPPVRPVAIPLHSPPDVSQASVENGTSSRKPEKTETADVTPHPRKVAATYSPTSAISVDPVKDGPPVPAKRSDVSIAGGVGKSATVAAGNRPPVYPRSARINGYEGTVILRVLVGTDGDVRRIEVLRTSGHDILDRAAIEAVYAWRFRAATVGPAAVEAWLDLPVEFRLRNSARGNSGGLAS